MPRIHIVHMGRIVHNGTTLKTVMRPSRHELLYELNNWFFDHFYATQQPIQYIPPLDDWTQSPENPRWWFIHFPTPDWKIELETEPMSFI